MVLRDRRALFRISLLNFKYNKPDDDYITVHFTNFSGPNLFPRITETLSAGRHWRKSGTVAKERDSCGKLKSGKNTQSINSDSPTSCGC